MLRASVNSSWYTHIAFEGVLERNLPFSFPVFSSTRQYRFGLGLDKISFRENGNYVAIGIRVDFSRWEDFITEGFSTQIPARGGSLRTGLQWTQGILLTHDESVLDFLLGFSLEGFLINEFSEKKREPNLGALLFERDYQAFGLQTSLRPELLYYFPDSSVSLSFVFNIPITNLKFEKVDQIVIDNMDVSDVPGETGLSLERFRIIDTRFEVGVGFFFGQ